MTPNERIAKAQERRAGRWARRRQLQQITGIRRVRNCGAVLDQDAGVTLAVANNADGTRTAGFPGLATCGSVWCCPQCAAKIATRRADELTEVMRAVEEQGGSAFLLTLTMRHARGDRLGLTGDERRRLSRLREKPAEYTTANEMGWNFDECQAETAAIEEQTLRERRGCWDVLSDAWARVTSGAAWKADQELSGGLLGWSRVVEVTDGDNGWHVHIHALLCFGADVSADIVATSLGARVFERWCNALTRAGFDASEEHGWDLRKVQLGDGDLADYFTKIAHEVTGAYGKESRRKGGRSQMRLLADAVETYEESALARWWEWETASENRRQLTWSTGARDLRKLAWLANDKTDDEIAAEDFNADNRLALSAGTWRVIATKHWATDLLDFTEGHDIGVTSTWLLRKAGPLLSADVSTAPG